LTLVVGSLAAFGCDAAISTGPRNPVGTVVVSVYTSGVEMDGDGYQVRIGDGEAQAVAVNGTVTVGGVTEGRQTLALEGVAVTCDAEGGEVRSLDVPAYQTVQVDVWLRCTPKPIVFARYGGGAYYLYRMNADGTGAKRIGPTGAIPRWSPNGARILFTDSRNSERTHLFVMNADGSDVTRLTEGYGGSWSPDGSHIVFTRWVQNTWAESYVYTMRANGDDISPLTQRVGDSPDWGPDGRIVFKEWELDGEWASGGWLSVVQEDGNVSRLLEGDDLAEPAWSPDGGRIVYSAYREDRHLIFTVDADGLGSKQRTGPGASENHPRWSPDGLSLIFTSHHASDPAGSDVRVGSPDDGVATPISLFVVGDELADIRPTP
jgi:dipeptidyl aminopeptidase/acylaminoacyl peptidase